MITFVIFIVIIINTIIINIKQLYLHILFRRIEKDHILRCRVIRKVGKINHIHPEYYLYNDDTNEFILAARRRKNIKKMDYIITTDENSITKTSPGYVGKLM